jgi:hypothetical protein
MLQVAGATINQSARLGLRAAGGIDALEPAGQATIYWHAFDCYTTSHSFGCNT